MNRQGLTLIEVVLALGLLSTLVAAVAPLVVQVHHARARLAGFTDETVDEWVEDLLEARRDWQDWPVDTPRSIRNSARTATVSWRPLTEDSQGSGSLLEIRIGGRSTFRYLPPIVGDRP